MESIAAIIVLLILIGLYFAPTIVAAMRGHQNTAPIAVVNTLLGWTVLAWIITLAWAFTEVRTKAPPPN